MTASKAGRHATTLSASISSAAFRLFLLPSAGGGLSGPIGIEPPSCSALWDPSEFHADIIGFERNLFIEVAVQHVVAAFARCDTADRVRALVMLAGNCGK
jgi:hypothetical protein